MGGAYILGKEFEGKLGPQFHPATPKGDDAPSLSPDGGGDQGDGGEAIPDGTKPPAADSGTGGLGMGLRRRGGPDPTPNASGSITPENHPVRYEGNLKIDNETFHFASGGNHGAYSSPPGDQMIESFTPPGNRPGTIFNQGYFRIGSKYDPMLGRNREGVLIHESSHGQTVHDVVSSGCFAIPRSEWPALENSLRNKLTKLGGKAILRVGSDGNAEVVPVGTPLHAESHKAEKVEAPYTPVPEHRPSLTASPTPSIPPKQMLEHPDRSLPSKPKLDKLSKVDAKPKHVAELERRYASMTAARPKMDLERQRPHETVIHDMCAGEVRIDIERA